MKQEDKDLLLKDLCARLPYGVKCDIEFDDGVVFPKRILMPIMIRDFTKFEYVKIIKPYLFPLSSMTEEIMNEIYTNTGVYDINIDSSVHIEVGTTFETLTKIFDILNKYHIDYKGLIPKGLAIDATNLNIY